MPVNVRLCNTKRSRIKTREASVNFVVELEQETDGRRIAEVVELPGVLAYRETPK
jgi:hypothetical protein